MVTEGSRNIEKENMKKEKLPGEVYEL